MKMSILNYQGTMILFRHYLNGQIIANSWGADCYLSIHLNSATDKSARGFESYIYSGTTNKSTIAFQNVHS